MNTLQAVLATAVVCCAGYLLSHQGLAQADTYGYGVNLKAEEIDDLLVQQREACPLVVEDPEGRPVRDESCKAVVSEEDGEVRVRGFKTTYVPIDSVEAGLRDTLDLLVRGQAGVYVDERDASRLLVNFRHFTFTCDSAPTDTDHPTLLRPVLDLFLPDPVPDGCESIGRAIGRQHYALTFENREKEVFTTNFLYATAVTIPLRHWFSYAADTSGVSFTVPGRASASVNANVMAGYRVGWTDFKYVRGAERKPDPVFHIGPGAFVGFSAVSVGEETSLTAEGGPREDDITVLVVSYGLGALITVRTFALGVFLGWDHGFADAADDWDFQDKPWIGIGLTTDQLAQVLGVR